MHKYLAFFLTLSLLFNLYCTKTVYAQPPTGKRQVAVISVEGLSFADLSQLRGYPQVGKWMKGADWGALSIRFGGPRTEANAYLQMGSGGQALYNMRSGTAYGANEEIEPGVLAADRMHQVTGKDRRRAPAGAIFFPGIYRLKQDNENKPFTSRIGLLGSRLQQAGVEVALYGNGDYGVTRARHAALLAMNEQGEIPRGDVTGCLLSAPEYPYGVRTDYDCLFDRLTAGGKPGLTVIQLADLARLYRFREMMDPSHFQVLYQSIMSDLDAFLGKVIAGRKSGQLIMLLSPAPNELARKEKSLLTPIAIWKGSAASGLLTSATTRQQGVVSGLDVLPTILSWFSLPAPSGLTGHVMTKAAEDGESAFVKSKSALLPEAEGGLGRLVTEVKRIDHIYRTRSTVMYTYVMLQIIVLLYAAVLWVWNKRIKKGEVSFLRYTARLGLLAMLLFPVLFLLEPLLPLSIPPAATISTAMLLALAAAQLGSHWPYPRLFAAVAACTVLAILMDGFLGAQAMRRSYMGYDPVIGARFYGLGNEYEGVLIGAGVLLFAALYESRRTSIKRGEPCLRSGRFWLAAAGFALILFYMAAPTLGTNAGGFLAGCIGFGVAIARLEGWKASKKILLLAAGGLLLGLVILVAGNLLWQGPPTHVGRAVHELVAGNWEEIGRIVQRKLEMNWRLIRISAWSKMFAVSLFVIGLLSLRPNRYLRQLSVRHPCMVKGFGGIIAGSLAGLLLNDSGIITAATAILFFVVPALYAAIGDEAEHRTV
ncbi:hypothetical protein ACI7RC_26930 [Brevibacillus sp. B_LB10_24]|uniref:hypothetical protein n=1 Tax=Brevibacillus sp. B_LB10_24 TaxID=3380645 RepID=UPI0038B9382C